MFLAFVQIQVALANMPEYIVSPRDFIPVPGNNSSAVELPIYAGRPSYLLNRYSSCWGSFVFPVSQVEVSGNSIKVMVVPDSTKNNLMKCTPMPPPSYHKIADIPALASGTYHLSYYEIPAHAFPPAESELPNYLITDFSFSVLAVKSVNSLSSWGLAILTLLLLLLGYTGLKMQRHRS